MSVLWVVLGVCYVPKNSLLVAATVVHEANADSAMHDHHFCSLQSVSPLQSPTYGESSHFAWDRSSQIWPWTRRRGGDTASEFDPPLSLLFRGMLRHGTLEPAFELQKPKVLSFNTTSTLEATSAVARHRSKVRGSATGSRSGFDRFDVEKGTPKRQAVN